MHRFFQRGRSTRGLVTYVKFLMVYASVYSVITFSLLGCMVRYVAHCELALGLIMGAESTAKACFRRLATPRPARVGSMTEIGLLVATAQNGCRQRVRIGAARE